VGTDHVFSSLVEIGVRAGQSPISLRALKKITELLYGQSSITSDTAHRESVYGVVARNGHYALTIAHNNVLALSHYAKARLFEGTHGVLVIDARDLRQARR
jgi:hypothetical protein